MNIENCWYRVSVKALISDNQGNILLCKEKKGIWDLPGGGLDHGENVLDNLKREIKEEMGLEITGISDKPKYFLTAYKENSKTRPWIANICYTVVTKDLNFVKSDECVEIGFFNKNNISDINVLPNVTKLFNQL